MATYEIHSRKRLAPVKVDFHCQVIFPRVHIFKIEILNGKSSVYVKVEPRSTFTSTRGLSYITFISRVEAES